MAFEKGNKLWELRTDHGKPRAYDSSENLWNACVKYFQWADQNPIKQQKLFHYQGEIKPRDLEIPRALTLREMCVHIGISYETWKRYSSDGHDYHDICKEIESIVYSQKFAGAAAGIFEANIIAKELGLKDKSAVDHTSSDGSMSPVDLNELDKEDRNAIRAILNKRTKKS